MRIAHVCADSGIALDGTKGASVHLRSLANAFAEDHDVRLVMRRHGPPDAAHGGTSPVAVAGFVDGPTLEVAVLAGGVPDVVYERYALGHLEGLHLAKRLHRPFVLEVNAPLVAEAQLHRPGTVTPADVVAEARLWREADLVVAVSTPLRDLVATTRGDRPMVVIGNACDPALFSDRATQDPAPTVGFLGHPKPWHGTEALPSVIAELRRRGIETRLLVVGGGPGADELVARARTLGVADLVEVTGALPQRHAIAAIGRAWLGIAPYRDDASPFYFSPIKVIEYLAAGLPVVATRVGDVPEMVGDGGLVVPAGDEQALTDAVERLLTDAPLRRRCADRGAERVLRERTWRAAAATTITAIESLRRDAA